MSLYQIILGHILIWMLAAFPGYTQQAVIVLKGGKIIDVTNFGKSENDLKDAVIIIERGKIKSVSSSRENVKIPKGANVIDITGKFVVPGLIDCFSALNNQAYANAFLYMGVTTIVPVDDIRRGEIFWGADPSPAKIKKAAYWGADSKNIAIGGLPRAAFTNINQWDDAKIERDIDSLASTGVKILLVHYGVVGVQLPTIVKACKKNNIATIGELGLSTYAEAVAAGIQSFVHTSRYAADILPDSMRKAYANAPFGPPASFFYKYITDHASLKNDDKLLELSELYRSNVGLIPTASMVVYPEMEFMKNPWKEPVASIIDEKDIEHEPLDKETGKRKTPSPLRSAMAPKLLEIDRFFVSQGAHFLTGSGTDAFGTIPGVSLHTELEMLSHMGLTNREVLAAATHNFSLLWNWTNIGKIEKGREADILVLSKNPLESLEALKDIYLLILDGKKIDRSALLRK